MENPGLPAPSVTAPLSRSGSRIRLLLSIFNGVPFALIYGFAARFVFATATVDGTKLGVTTVAFGFLMPLATGVLTVALSPERWRSSAKFALFMPWLSSLIMLTAATVFGVEYFICVAMAFPVVFIMASLGGAIVFFIYKARQKPMPQLVGALLLLPYLAGPIEAHIPLSDSYHVVQTQITIHAPESVIWQNIISVSKIQPSERHFSLLFDVFGAPRPLEARLDGDASGAMRYGIFEGGLMFNETISRWEPNRRLDFEIQAENHIAPNPQVSVSPWNEIGGAIFAVPNASYVLEPVGDGNVILHLDSTHRLTSRWNEYGSIWTDWGMSEFQNQILQVVKARAEAAR